MKKCLLVIVVFFSCVAGSVPVFAQETELAQLALNIEKLAQFKQILSDLKKGYEILTGGYNTIKNISEGNFKLHQVFLDGLMEVSPAVKKYKRVGDIIDYQLRMVKEYKSAFNRFKQSKQFTDHEIGYIGNVYSNLISRSLEDLDDLSVVITAGKLRMSDEERLAAIDDIYKEVADKLGFLRAFNNQTQVLALQRAKESKDVKVMKGLYGSP
ncbi:MAG TPA: TerB family tellurite resistance protein [Niabella sp.]|nr:TerB family tellurite resistance protein [Niabella sp.]